MRFEGARGFLCAAAAAKAAFTVRAEVNKRLETPTLGAAGGAAMFVDELGFGVFEKNLIQILLFLPLPERKSRVRYILERKSAL